MKIITFSKLIMIFFILNLSLIGEELNFAISPKRFHIDTTKESINEIEIYNGGTEVLKLRVYKESGKDEWQEDLSCNLEIYPKSLILNPKTGTTVKFIYTPLKTLDKNKKYRGYIFFKELPVKSLKKNMGNKKMVIYNEVGISIYGN